MLSASQHPQPTSTSTTADTRRSQPEHQHQLHRQGQHRQQPQDAESHLFFDVPREYSLEYPADFDLDLDVQGDFDSFASLTGDYLPPDAMQSDAWGGVAQFAPKMNRFAHQRESSLSSLGSAGPASPYAHNTSNPQIAVTDSASDSIHGLPDVHDGAGNPGNYYQLAKSMGSLGYQNLDHAMPEMAYPVAIQGPGGKTRQDRSLLPPPEFGGGSNRSHPTSVASSIAGGDSPATPTNTGDVDNLDRRRKGGYGTVPKLDRSLTDIYSDELYSPNFAITSTSPSQPQLTLSPGNDVFNQRLSAANNQHLSASHSSPMSTTSPERSPFRAASPLAMSASHDFAVAGQQGLPFNSAQRMREQGKAQQDAQFFQQQMGGSHEPETPKTISPKDAILEFTEHDGDGNFPLFPDSTSFEMDQMAKAMISQDGSGHHGGHPGYLPPHMAAAGVKVPQQYPFIARMQHDAPPSRLGSAGGSSSSRSATGTPGSHGRPMMTAADSGTYTCTYHGCTLRFETPALLQKHKREGHRQTQGVAGQRAHETDVAASLLNSQAGPHRCDRINPSTGKPCSTVFSRPYDLTRHEDTIHNGRKQKVRCNLCTEEKTFSRADALTRHYRVCHPDVELPGKHRRRGGV